MFAENAKMVSALLDCFLVMIGGNGITSHCLYLKREPIYYLIL